MLKEASRLYAASWVRDIGPELRPNEYKKDEDDEDKPNEAKSRKKEKEHSTLEDLGKWTRFFIGNFATSNLTWTLQNHYVFDELIILMN